MLKETVFHEDLFYAHFKPFRHPSSNFNIWGGHGLETFGEDFLIARSIDPSRIWTVVEGDVGTDLGIIPGLHFVNRICSLVTHESHADAAIAFRVEAKPHSLSPIGLARRMTTLRKLMRSQQLKMHLAY
jgi:hypothetical protein